MEPKTIPSTSVLEEKNAASTAPKKALRRTPLQPVEALNIPDALLKGATVVAVTGLSMSSIYRLARIGELVPVKRGIRCTRWRAADVKTWLQASSGKAA